MRLICWCIFKFLLHRCSVWDLCPCIVYLYILFICHSEMPGSLKYFFYTPLAPYSLTYWHLFYFSKFVWYCTISNCLAWPVTHDHCAEILLRQRPVWRVILAKFRRTKISAGHSQAWVLSECFVTAGQGQCDPWLTPISAPSGGPVTRDTPNNSKWYSINSLFSIGSSNYQCEREMKSVSIWELW